MTHQASVALKTVNIQYDAEHIIKDLTLSFEQGKSYTIIGPSGCGKTSLLYAIAGLKPMLSGSLEFMPPNAQSQIAMVLQEYGLFPWKTVWQNITLGLIIRDKALSAEAKTNAEKIAKELGLLAHLDKYPQQLSGGQKQRVAIARYAHVYCVQALHTTNY